MKAKTKTKPAKDKRDVFITFKGETLTWLEEQRVKLHFDTLQELLHDLVRQKRIAEQA